MDDASSSSYDLWAGEAYDPNGVFHASMDKRGHSDWIKIRVPQGWLGEIASVVAASPELRNSGDFYRTALYHGIKWFQERMGQDLPPGWGEMIMRRIALDDELESVREERRTLEDLRDLISNTRDPVLKQERILSAIRTADSVRDSTIADELRKLG